MFAECSLNVHKVWVLSPSGVLTASVRNVENFITHNGDFEFFMLNGQLQTVEFVQEWLIKTLHCPMPSGTDSMAVAGMIDLFRTQGNWFVPLTIPIMFSLCISTHLQQPCQQPRQQPRLHPLKRHPNSYMAQLGMLSNSPHHDI